MAQKVDGDKKKKKRIKKGEHYRIIDPSFSVLTHLDYCSPEVRVEECGRICYKSEERITATSAVPFCRAMIMHKHNSTLEMAVVTHEVSDVSSEDIAAMEHVSKHVVIDDLGVGTYLITASMRTLRELYMLLPYNPVVHALVCDVMQDHPVFFEDLTVLDRELDILSSPSVTKISLEHLDRVVQYEHRDVWRRHRFVAVKFIVNRAVTHELVRHRPCSFLQESQRYCNYGSDKFSGIVTLIKPIFYLFGTKEHTLWERSVAASSWDYLRLLKTSSPQAARTVMPNSCKTEIIVFCSIAQWHHICHMRTSGAAEPSMREVMIPLKDAMSEVFSGEKFDLRSPEGYLVPQTEGQ